MGKMTMQGLIQDFGVGGLQSGEIGAWSGEMSAAERSLNFETYKKNLATWQMVINDSSYRKDQNKELLTSM